MVIITLKSSQYQVVYAKIGRGNPLPTLFLTYITFYILAATATVVRVVVTAASPQNNKKNDYPATVVAAEETVRTHVIFLLSFVTLYIILKPLFVLQNIC